MNGQQSRDLIPALTASALVAVLMFTVVTVYVWRISTEDEPVPEGVLGIGYLEPVDSLNPFIAISEPAQTLLGLVYDCLHSVGEDMEPGPNLALNSTPVDDISPFGSAWDYDLTPNAIWHDGVPFSADDVVFTLNFCSFNYSAIWMYRSYTYFINYAERMDGDTVRVHFFDRSTGEPMAAAFADSLLIPILPKHLLQNLTVSEITFQWLGYFDGSSPPMVGTGPFMATDDIADEWAAGEEITLVRNPTYHWSADRSMSIQFERVRMLSFDDPVAMRLSLENSELDVARLPQDQYSSVKENASAGILGGVQAFDGLTGIQRMTAVKFNSFDAPNPIIYDVSVRQALATATNRSAIIEAEYDGYAEEGSTIISPVLHGWHLEMDEQDTFALDVGAANSILEDAGYRFTEDSPTIRVATSDSTAVKDGLVAVNTSLSFRAVVLEHHYDATKIMDHLELDWGLVGVRLNFTVYSGGVVPITIPSQDLNVYELGGGDPDPSQPLFAWSSEGPWPQIPYYCYSENETYDQLVTGTVCELDPETRKELVHECQREFYRDAAAIILAYPYSTYAWRTDTFEGWGDWEAHPGRSLDAHWGGNEIFFDLMHIPPATDDASVPLWAFVAMGITAVVAAASLVAALRIKRNA